VAFLWVAVAFIFGLFFKKLNLPPLIGYLVAGFFLNDRGVEAHAALDILANLGITLMLFTIGLKLNLRSMLEPRVWAVALSHTGLLILLLIPAFIMLMALGAHFFTDIGFVQAFLIAFACSFSSTICAIKLLEDDGEVKSSHGQMAIGILIMQDIVAVLFLVLAAGKTPNIWLPILCLLPLLRPALHRLVALSGHGEVLPLCGFFLALGGAALFEFTGLKGDLGALVLGMLLAGTKPADELSKSLMHFKDLFLIGFFLSIGFTALPDKPMLFAALCLALLIPLKSVLFYSLFNRFEARPRDSFLSTITLSNYSEFGLIVMAVCVDRGWLPQSWLVIFSLAVAISFLLASLLNIRKHRIYKLLRFPEPIPGMTAPALPERCIRTASVLVLGMGRVGTGAYDYLRDQFGDRVWGVDFDPETVERHQREGRQVLMGDGEDSDFWSTIGALDKELIMLALPSLKDNQEAIVQIRQSTFKGRLAVITRYESDESVLKKAGADVVFNLYAGAGAGFAEATLATSTQAVQ
jgi:glutathione-regulated potassium-efflux system ancillary protein KefC